MYTKSESAMNMFAQVKEYLKETSETIWENGIGIASGVVHMIVRLSSFFLFFASVTTDFFLFLGSLFYLLKAEKSCLDVLQAMLLGLNNKGIVNQVSFTMNSIFLFSLKISTFHMMFTWLVYSALELPFVYTTALFAGFLAVLPIVQPIAVCIPHIIALVWKANYFSAFCLAFLELFVYWNVDPAITGEIENSHRNLEILNHLSISWGISPFFKNLMGVFQHSFLRKFLQSLSFLISKFSFKQPSCSRSPLAWESVHSEFMASSQDQ